MPEVAGIVTGLRSAMEGFERAQQATSTAEANLGMVVADMSRRRFAGIAARLLAVQKQVGQTVARQRSLVEGVQQCVARVNGVTDGMSPKAVVDTLSPVVEKLDETSSAAKAVLQQLNTAKSQVNAALDGGQPGPLLASIDAAIKPLGHGNIAVKAAKDSTQQVIALSRQAGNF